MKTYPSIAKKLKGKQRERRVYVFDKIDGSNLRFEWSNKHGWFRWGSRYKLLTESHPVFGNAFRLFQKTFCKPIETIAQKENWEGLVAFTEFFGPNSLGGQHQAQDQKSLCLFDIAPYKKGFLGPTRFLSLFGHLPTPSLLGEFLWNEEFVKTVYHSKLPGITLEGVVGKAGDGHTLVMAKAKTEVWIQRILARYGEEVGNKLIKS